MENIKSVEAIIPQVQTKISLIPVDANYAGYYEEGYSFAPNLKIGVSKIIAVNQEFTALATPTTQ